MHAPLPLALFVADLNLVSAWLLAGTGGLQHQHRGSTEAHQAGHLGLPAVPAQEGQAEEEGEGGSRNPHAQLETSDAPSLSVHNAPSIQRRTPSPDTDADMPHLLTLEEAAVELAAAELERRRQEWRCARPDSPFRGN